MVRSKQRNTFTHIFEALNYLFERGFYVANEIITGLHGRFFSGRVLEAARIPLANYNELFADSIGKDKILQVDED